MLGKYVEGHTKSVHTCTYFLSEVYIHAISTGHVLGTNISEVHSLMSTRSVYYLKYLQSKFYCIKCILFYGFSLNNINIIS